jgi:hypothetical protein
MKTRLAQKGAKHIGEALKINKALTDLWCVPPPHNTLPHTTATRCARFVVCTGAGSRDCSLFGPCSLSNNKFGSEGAKHIGEALKINKTLTDLKCVLAPHDKSPCSQLPKVLDLLSAGEPVPVIATCLAHAVLLITRSAWEVPSTSVRLSTSTRHSPNFSACRSPGHADPRHSC